MGRNARIGALTVLVLVIALALVGCGPSLQGEWWSTGDGTITTIDKESMSNSDGTQTKYSDAGDSVIETTSGLKRKIRFAIDGDTLTLTPEGGTKTTYLRVGSAKYETAKAAWDKKKADAKAAAEEARKIAEAKAAEEARKIAEAKAASRPAFRTFADKLGALVAKYEKIDNKLVQANNDSSKSSAQLSAGYEKMVANEAKATAAIRGLAIPTSLPADVAAKCEEAVEAYSNAFALSHNANMEWAAWDITSPIPSSDYIEESRLEDMRGHTLMQEAEDLMR